MKILILKPIAEAEQNTVQRMDEFIGCKGKSLQQFLQKDLEVLISSQFGSNAIPAKTIGKKIFHKELKLLSRESKMVFYLYKTSLIL